ncbi:MAG: HAMP domain-containing sensor histidine kinase [Microscillaceae bacterium]|nr:HAMP domain-containing sensor histidine kinase [Microscillaceae bacterium]
MFGKFKSLKSRFIAFFLIFTGITASVAFTGLWFYGKAGRLSRISSQLDRVLIQVLQVIKQEHDFFNYEMINPRFFKKGESKYLDQHNELMLKVKDNLYLLLKQEEMKELNVNHNLVKEDIKNIVYELESYERNFQALILLSKKRGFKDEGLEGRMRDKIHRVEKLDYGISKIDLLTLRRIEKDYIIRKDMVYVKLLDKKSKEVIQKIQNDGTLTEAQKLELSGLIHGYYDDFYELVKIELDMGVNHNTGKKAQMRKHAEHVASLLNTLLGKINQEIFVIRNQQVRILNTIIILAVILSLILSYYLAGTLTKPIFKLSIAIQHIVEKNFEGDLNIVENHSQDEIGELTYNFNAMLGELQRRLAEIREQNHELEIQNEELNTLNTHLNQSEDKLQRNIRIKDKFFSIITHDLREPLGTMLIFMRSLENKVDFFDKEEIREFAIENQQSLLRVIDLLENLLQWSLSQSGELQFNPESLNLKDIIQNNILLYHKKAKEAKNIDLIFTNQEDILIEADKNMLNFVLRNLISNAIKFSYNDSQIHIAVKPYQDEIEVSVKDQGIGMSEAVLFKLLNTEEHYSSMGTHKERGTGFGLLLSKSFIEQNKGKLSILSAPNEGTTVSFTLKKSFPDYPDASSKIQARLTT